VSVLGQRVPPDWVISLDHDTVRNVLSVVGLSPRLATIPPGDGVIISLVVDAQDVTPVRVPLDVRNVVISHTSGRPYPSRAMGGYVDVNVERVQLRVGTGVPIQPGETGSVALFMDNPQPVMAFQLVVRPASGGLQLLDVIGGTRLPADAQVDYIDLGNEAVRVIVSSFSNVPIAVGRGPVVSLVYRVDPDTPEGLIGLDLEQVVLSDARGVTLPQTTVSGSFPVGEVQAVFSPAASEGEPGRTVAVSVGLVNSVALCGFEIAVGFDPQYLSLLTLEALERIPDPGRLSFASIDSGRVRLTYAAVDGGEPIAAGSGPLFDLVLRLDAQLPRDTTLSLDLGLASAWGCREELIFAVGQEAVIAVGQAPLAPSHFAAHLIPTGVTHIIRVQAVTLGGVYLKEGDELAAIDSVGWINSSGETGSVVAGAGVVQADGSVDIRATVGFDLGDRGYFLPGARPGDTIVFHGWNRQSNVEGMPGRDARYVLGAGVWGENNGLTIIDLIRLPAEAGSATGSIPDELTVEFLAHDPSGDTTRIRFGIPMEMDVRVSIFSLMGRELITLHDGLTSAGYHEVEWDGTDREGVPVKSGMVFYQVRTPSQTITRKLLLLR
ncbi:MAG: hypothetical protein IID14_04070, partial [Candidatus Marinimicrobia bacterium]|nr:hypothetical protein [Candidatus Neomarinimicrobiota bacterium]